MEDGVGGNTPEPYKRSEQLAHRLTGKQALFSLAQQAWCRCPVHKELQQLRVHSSGHREECWLLDQQFWVRGEEEARGEHAG